MGFFAIPGVCGGFFLSAWIVMNFWGVISPDAGIMTIGHLKAMITTLGLWLAAAPFIASMVRRAQGRWFFVRG